MSTEKPENILKWASTNEALDFAISKEEGAAKFYTELAEKAENQGMRLLFEDFAKEELGHKAKLEKIKESKEFRSATSEVPDLKIAEFLVDIKPEDAGNDYQNALIFAMKEEKTAFQLYSMLAGVATEPHIRDLFLSMAQEEAKHKLRFEIEYDDYVLSEN